MTAVANRTSAISELARIEAELRRRRLHSHVDLPQALLPFLAPSRYKGAYGGRGGAKSWGFAELLLARCDMASTRAVCVREHQATLDDSVKQLLVDRIAEFGLGDRFIERTNYISAPHDGVILFRGMKNQTAEGIKSLEGFDIAWFEEAQSASQRSLDLLRPTIRKPGSELWFTWNPDQPTDPIDKLLRSETAPPDSIVIRVNYHDNPYLSKVLAAEMEFDRGRDADHYAHVWLGDYQQNSEARVFKNWTVAAFDTPDSVTLRYGFDWGYSVDPAAGVRCWLNPKNKRQLMIDYETWGIGVKIEDLPEHFSKLPGARTGISTADSSQPQTIRYMKDHGFPRLKPSIKGNGSVKEGIEFLQSFDITIHPRCKHVIDEFTLYAYKKDALTGEATNVLAEKKNHTIDGTRYAAEALRKANQWCVA